MCLSITIARKSGFQRNGYNRANFAGNSIVQQRKFSWSIVWIYMYKERVLDKSQKCFRKNFGFKLWNFLAGSHGGLFKSWKTKIAARGLFQQSYSFVCSSYCRLLLLDKTFIAPLFLAVIASSHCRWILKNLHSLVGLKHDNIVPALKWVNHFRWM